MEEGLDEGFFAGDVAFKEEENGDGPHPGSTLT